MSRGVSARDALAKLREGNARFAANARGTGTRPSSRSWASNASSAGLDIVPPSQGALVENPELRLDALERTAHERRATSHDGRDFLLLFAVQVMHVEARTSNRRQTVDELESALK